MKNDFEIADLVVAKDGHILGFSKNLTGEIGEIVSINGSSARVKFNSYSYPIVCWLEELRHFRLEPTISLDGLERTNVIYLSDPVDSPSHYADRPVEVIEIIRSTLTKEQFEGFCLGNLLKYNMRAGLKGDAQEDYKKGEKYYNWYKESVDSETKK